MIKTPGRLICILEERLFRIDELIFVCWLRAVVTLELLVSFNAGQGYTRAILLTVVQPDDKPP